MTAISEGKVKDERKRKSRDKAGRTLILELFQMEIIRLLIMSARFLDQMDLETNHHLYVNF